MIDAATPPLTPGSAVPAIVREWLPTSFSVKHPATIEAIWAAAMSIKNVVALLLTGFFIAADSIGADESSTTLWAFFVHYHWWIALVTIYFPSRKATVAFGKAKTPAP